MPNPFLDYIPCDLTLYSQEILPIWRLAQDGDIQPLQRMIQTAPHISLWPIFNISNPLPDEHFAGPLDFFGFRYFQYNGPAFWTNFFSSEYFPARFRNDLLNQIAERNELDFWSLCLRNLPAFISMRARTYTQSGSFLHNCLFYTFCCQLPSETLQDSRVLGGDDSLYLWDEYISRDAGTRALWSLFHQPAPKPLADQLLFPQNYEEYLAISSAFEYSDRPRDFFSHMDSLTKHERLTTSFLTTEECSYLLNHLRTRAEPELEGIIDGCVTCGCLEKEWLLPPEFIQKMQEDFSGESASTKYELSGDLSEPFYW